MKLSRTHVTSAICGAAILTAIVGGGVAVKQLTEGSAATTAASSVRVQAQNAAQPVPFLGPFAQKHKGYPQCGPAVRLMEGALRHTTPPVRLSTAQNCIGTATTKQLIKFQTRHHIPPSGIYGLRTHKALAHAYTKPEVSDLAYLATQRLAALHRATIGIVTAHAYNERGTMGYCNFGQLEFCSLRTVWAAWPTVPTHLDCSAYVSWVYYQSGLPNPNGSGVGTTKTLILHGRAIAPGAPLKVGDLVFYSKNNSHVAIYIGHGQVSSHGQPGLKIVPWNYRYVYSVHRYID